MGRCRVSYAPTKEIRKITQLYSTEILNAKYIVQRAENVENMIMYVL